MRTSVQPRRRRWLIGISLVVHLAIVLGLFVAGFWKLDRLEAGKRSFDLAVAPPPPAPAGSPAAAPLTPFKLKQKKIVHELVVPAKIEDKAPAVTQTPGTGSGSDSGKGSGEGPPDSPGECTDPPCGPGEQTTTTFDEHLCDQPPVLVPPAVIKGMRISGETQIHPSDVDKTAIVRSGKDKVQAMFKVCVGTKGEVAQIAMAKGSGYASWDAAIAAALRNWRYRPYQLTAAQYAPRDPRCPKLSAEAHAVSVCGMVTFIYAIQ